MKQLLTIITLCFVFFSAESQRFNYGMYTGGSLSQWNNEVDIFIDEIEYELNFGYDFSGFSFENGKRIGAAIGGFLEIGLGEHLYIRPELSYIQKGAKFIGSGMASGTYMDMNMTVQTDYLEFPLLIKYSPVKQKSLLKPYIIAGPNISYVISSKLKATAKAYGDRESDTANFSGVEDLNYGVCIGGGFKFTEIALEFRYQKGLTQVLTEAGSEGLNIKADIISINLLIHMF